MGEMHGFFNERLHGFFNEGVNGFFNEGVHEESSQHYYARRQSTQSCFQALKSRVYERGSASSFVTRQFT
jgi:hypothetical protein